MISLTKGSERDLFWNFARAEFELPPGVPRHTQPVISRSLRDRLLRDERDTFSNHDWRALRESVLSTRLDLVQPLLDLGLTWYRGELPEAEWANVRVMNLRIFERVAPNRLLGELVTALDQGAVPAGWKPSYYRRLRATFKPSRMHGDPILVAERAQGPFTLVEGTTRLCVLESLRRQGRADVVRLPALLGLSDRLREWEFY